MPATAFEYFTGRRNARVVRLLEVNEDVNTFVAALLDHLVSYAEHEGIEFKDVRLDRPFVTSDGYIKARITR